eukprot:TRINITY_DN6379_c0_g3_i1.p1 TRINITY_DN6379_c0_g3~~TRINITY_DN6379_c0_g3_i1.p1  ORF type:complete len:197 (+),score=35.47 TRINITY_DN6379_c0_g3_i1:140-730(+)
MQSIKCVAVGDGAVGKSCLLITYSSSGFPEEYIPTVFDNYSVNTTVDGKIYNLSMWDTAGQEDYDRLRPLSYPQTDVFLLTYSVISPSSFHNVGNKWFPEVSHYTPDASFILVGTKIDLVEDPYVVQKLSTRSEHVVLPQEALQLSREIGAYTSIQCSALKQIGISDIFNEAIRAVISNSSRKQEQEGKKRRCTLF